MSDNISRKTAKDAIAEKVFHDLTDEFYGVMQVLDELPSTDRKGNWVYHENDMCCVRWNKWECSECHKRVENKSDFCPNCGADMRGADDESTL